METTEKPKSPLGHEEYIATQMHLLAMGRVAKQLKLEAFLLMINEAQTAAALDPTLWQKGAANVEAIKNLAISILPVREAFDNVFAAIVQTEALKLVDEKKPQ